MDTRAIASVAIVPLALLLWFIAFLVARHARTPGRMELVAFLVLVGTNYFVDFGTALLRLTGADLPDAWRLAAFASRLDPPFLLLFALAAAGGSRRGADEPAGSSSAIARPGWKRWALLAFLPAGYSAYVATYGDAQWYDPYVFVTLMAVCYGGAFAAIASAWLHEHRPAERDRLQRLMLALGVVVLPRLALFYVDLGFATGPAGRARPETVLFMDVPLWTMMLVVATLSVRAANDVERPHVRASMRTLAALLLVIEFVWLLRFFPGLREAAFPLLYSSRWFLFGAVVSNAMRHEGLLGMPEAAQRRMHVAVLGLVGVLAVSAIAALLSGLDGVDTGLAYLGAAALLGAAIATAGTFRLTFFRGDDASARRIAVYRAHVDAGAPDDELERLRAELGISERQASEARSLAVLERRTGKTRLAALSPGDLFAGRYEMGPVIGAGATGRVYAAHDRVRGEPVVLKEVLGASETFLAEVDAAARVDHPHLVRFLGVEPIADGSALVLARVDGTTLAQRVAQGPLREPEARRIGRDLYGALAALHEAGVAHLDVKPENIVLRADGSPVLLDFGAAQRASSSTRSWGPARAGTPGHMAPEQAAGGAVGPATDVYALAKVLHDCSNGHAWTAHLQRALAHDPAARPSARELAALLG